MNSKKMRYCIAINCPHLKKRDCEVKECVKTDVAKAVADRRAELEVKHGGSA